MSKLPVLTSFSTSFLNDFSVLVFEAPTKSLTNSSKNSQKGARSAAKDKNSAKRAVDALFAEFWAEYPRKEKKAAALSRYKKLTTKHKGIMAALAVYKQKTENIEPQFIKLPTTFLTDYEDFLPVSTAPDLTEAFNSPINPQKGGADLEIIQTVKAAIRALESAMNDRYGDDTGAKIERVSQSPFALCTSESTRIFDDQTAAIVEAMGGTWAAILELNNNCFDDRASMALESIRTKTA